MPLPQSIIGHRSDPVTVTVERGRLSFFAGAIGERNPVYFDVAAARAAGHRDLPVPPTFLFGLALAGPGPFRWLADLGIDLRHVLHGAQGFRYHLLAHAGDRLTLRTTITGTYEKKGGAMQFIDRLTTVHRHDCAHIADLTATIVVRTPPAPAP
jgi:acyl dehydratase